MRIIPFLILYTFLVYSCNETESNNLVEDGDVMEVTFSDTCNCVELLKDTIDNIYKKDNKAFTGICIAYYPNSDSKYVEKNILAGQLHGTVVYYGKDGEVLIEEVYENGDAKKTSETELVNCNCDELEQMESHDSNLPTRFSLDDMPFTGTCKSFYPESEQVYMEASYQQGLLEGYTTFYNHDGSILYMEVYALGSLKKTVY